jgi:hypothetical protein
MKRDDGQIDPNFHEIYSDHGRAAVNASIGPALDVAHRVAEQRELYTSFWMSHTQQTNFSSAATR